MSGGNKKRSKEDLIKDIKNGLVVPLEGEDIIQYDDLGKKFVNPSLVELLQNNGFYVCSVELANRFMKESLELAQLKATYATTVSKGD